MSDSEHDDDFEAYLKRRVPIKKGTTPPDRLEPPPELDRIVIGNARKAIQGAAPIPVYRAPKWALAVGLAATIVISCAVVLELGLRAKHPPPVEEPVETDLVAEAPSADVESAPAALPAAAPLEDRSNAKPAAKSLGQRTTPRVAKRIKLPAIPTTPWPLVTPNTAPTVAADAAERTDADKSRTRLARAEVAASRARSDAESEPTVNAPEAYAAAEKPAAAEPGTGTLEEAVVSRRAAAPQPLSPAAAAPLAPAHPDPATWLSQIEKLRSAGQTAEVERQIKLFRAAYPAYPVPNEELETR